MAQRLGVTTEASQSLQTALSVAAQVSTTVKASLDAGYLSQSDARAQALSRQPTVVGFAGSEPEAITTARATNNRSIGKGFFGWLFGPEFSVKDSKRLALHQGVRSYGVNADVSFPGWWSYITIDISTAWIENWQSDTIIAPLSETSKNLSTVRKSVSLPISDATYDSLTNYIAAQQYGPQNSRIFASSFTPNTISACTSSVTFQISGTNIWRTDSVYLGGVKAKTINVLPDMNGIAAEFDMNAVYGTLVNTDSTVQPIPLVVSAEQGSAAPFWVYVAGKRQTVNGATTCQSPFLLPTDYDQVPATIVSFSPLEICSDVTAVPLVVQGVSLPNGSVKLHSAHFDLTKTSWDGNWSQRELDMTLKKGVKLTPGPLAIALTYGDPTNDLDYRGSFSLNLTVKDCSTDEKSAGKDKTSNQAPAKTPAKATLKTDSVKMAKDQTVKLITAVPESYFAIAVAVRPQTKDSNAQWIDSLSAKATPGKAAEVTGSMDLSSLNAKPGDKLDVVVKIRTRPDVEWQQITADKALTVSAAP